jgi:hypothetical protein
MGLFDSIVPAIAAKFQIPPSAVQAAIATIVKAHQGDPTAQGQIKAAASGSSDRLRSILTATYGALKAQPAFWVAHYATKAKTQPLHPSHPYAAHVAHALQRVGAPALPPVLTAGRGRGGGGGRGRGGRGHGGGASVVYGGGTDGPFYEYDRPDYVLLDAVRVEQAPSPGLKGAPTVSPRQWNKGGN